MRPHKSPAHTVKDQMLAGFYSTHAQGPFVQGSRISYNQFTNRQHLDANLWVRVGQDSERESFVTDGRTGRALEGARILTGRVGFGKGFWKVFRASRAERARTT